jgi:hypothetical protein
VDPPFLSSAYSQEALSLRDLVAPRLPRHAVRLQKVIDVQPVPGKDAVAEGDTALQVNPNVANDAVSLNLEGRKPGVRDGQPTTPLV